MHSIIFVITTLIIFVLLPHPVSAKTSFGTLMATPIPTTAPAVLGAETFIGPMMISTTPTILPTPTTKPIQQSSVIVALLGDSMMDTLGPTAPALQTALKKLYPKTQFTIKNFGVGGTGIQYGIKRITESYTYLGKSYTSLVATNPDIVVIESFGYNPFGDDAPTIDAHWLLLAKAVDAVKANLPNAKIIIAATIAPNANKFGDGAPGISFSVIDKWQRVTTIKKYLENTIRFAEGEHLPLADAYHPSLLSDGNGNLAYINSGDHIHYSDKGRALMASAIANSISKNNLLE
ncbi:MAG: SGNH/GDSL hydrolase family protein [Microgenomates group bacterium]